MTETLTPNGVTLDVEVTGDVGAADQALRVAVAGGTNLNRESLRLALENEDASLRITNMGRVDEALRRIVGGNEVDVLLVTAEANGDGCGNCLDSVNVLFGKESGVAVVLLCGTSLCSRARLAAAQGLAGVIDSTATIGLLVGALRVVGAGGTCFPASVVGEGRAGTALPVAQTFPLPQLSPRQREVLSLLCEGQSNKEMGRALNLTESTVKAHISSILKRLHANNRTQAVLIASKAAEI